MKAYKGFNKDMTCRGYQFKEGEQYHEDNAKLCESGFHACVNPLDCFNYYAPGSSEFHEVELNEITDEKSNDTKICGKTIKIGAKLDVLGICKAHFEYVREKCIEKIEKGDAEQASAGYSGSASAGEYGSASAGEYGSASAGYSGSASAGEYGSASAGDRGSASAGNRGSASAGYSGSASAGYSGSASAGNRGSASAGNRGSASAGEYGSASAGEYGSASAGNRGRSVSGQIVSVGKEGCAVAKGNNCRVKGGLGAIIVIAEENDNDYGIKSWKAAVVDGKIIKADIWYVLKGEEFVEWDGEHNEKTD